MAAHFILHACKQGPALLHHAPHCCCYLLRHVVHCLPRNGKSIRVASGFAPSLTYCNSTKFSGGIIVIAADITIYQQRRSCRPQCLGLVFFGSQFRRSHETNLGYGIKCRSAQSIVPSGIACRRLEQPDQSRQPEGMHGTHCVWPACFAIVGPLCRA